MQFGIGLIAYLFAAAITLSCPHAENAVQGNWLTEEKTSIVEIYGCGGDTLCGRLLWLRLRPSDNNPEAVDDRNPRPELRRRKLCGLVMMWALRPAGQSEWDGGSLYDPQSGKTYRGKILLEPNDTLSLRGYIGISLIGRSQIWTRFRHPIPPCPANAN